ncbi:DUF581 domain-containing protein [Melia azedarach]|uniref:DUF581 domain-containing protein n=1 Tax=Melia azedarach TaxID=155640 RepID=A0ACC1YVF5_MELAZ|nr:DUF581 domain-containing protein [Melia azedarach]
MQVKRSRVARSSSFDEAGLLGVLNQQTPHPAEFRWEPLTATKNAPPFPKNERSGPVILTVSSPELLRDNGYVRGQGHSGNFLERCYFCKQKMLEKDVFMYGSFCGFCSPECRGQQILIDNALERAVKQPRDRLSSFQHIG